MGEVTRRIALLGGAAAATAVAAADAAPSVDDAPDQDDAIVSEAQAGDPGPMETLKFNPVETLNAVHVYGGKPKAAFEKRIVDIRGALVAEALKHVGESRASSRDKIQNYLDVFELPFAINGKPIPFCAAGISFVALSAYARQKGISDLRAINLTKFLGDVDHNHFYPSPSVLDMKYTAMGKRRWIPRGQAVGQLNPRPGWLVIFDWNHDGTPDHVGLVESFGGGVLNTIEFNTSAADNRDGGAVARRKRTMNQTVQGFIRPELVRSV